MWRALFLAASVATFHEALSSVGNEPTTSPTTVNLKTTTDPSCGCGEVHPPKCGKNEVYDNCKDTTCRPTMCSELGYSLDCKKCKPGCKCKNGYVRNDKGVCIPINDCPSCGGDKNAQSGCGNNCGKMCGDGKKPGACSMACWLNGCDCRDGFQYDTHQRKCVKKEDCTPICKDNEVYSPCANGGCGAKNCSQINDPHICIDPICIKGCVCQDGYLRNDVTGKCVPKDQCPKNCPGQNEYYEPCIHACGSQNCSDRGKIYHCPIIVPGKCDSSGCRCKPGYLRNAKGVCILEKECPPLDCPSGEVWSKCPTVPCEGDKCPKTRDSPQSCPTGIVCSPPRCVCGYNRKRAENGTCIPISDCPPFKCGKNEMYLACPYNCPGEKCSDYINQPECPLSKIRIVNCRPACKCIKGYYRDEKGNCIPACDCIQHPPKCGKNEVYDNCTSTSCKPTLCSELGYPLNCDKKCKPGCKCKDGYVRNDKGVCIPIHTCPSCGGDENAQSGCGYNCGKTCASIGQKPPIICPKICKLNSCDCRDGYYYDPNQKKCVKKQDCTPPACPSGEVWSTCPTVPCEGDKCPKTRDSPQSCPTGIVCSPPRCVCGYNRKRAENGTCILIPDCPPFKCAKNEMYVACPSNCPGEKCSDYINQTKCPPYKIGIIVNCKPACKCKKGYYRDEKGNCIPASDCIQHPPKCGKNEVYDNCSSTTCKPTLCSELGYPLNCDKKCKPGCKCKDGYVRNDKGVCIPINTCPSCGGDENAQSGCGINCGKTCASIGQKPPIICPLICKLNSCDCRDGYYYDPNQKKCVKKEDCTPTCKENEIYSTCINGGCGPKNCSQINKPSACVHPKICIKGCICKEGYLRADNGTCIPKDQCPKNCPGQNEYYEPCIHACGSQNCSDKGKIYHCPIIVPGKCDSSGCRCKPGYLRDAKGVCIPEKECPPPACPSGEVWSTCPTVPCEGDKCPKTRDSPQSCPTGIVCSPPRCVCGYNRKRAENGTCILIPDCPPFKCAKNEMYVACPSNCPGEKCSDYINQTKCPPYKIGIIVNCKPACKCKKGYYRDEKGNCIPASDCIQHPPKCGKNEVYDNCSSTTCKPTLCSELGYPLNCDKKCKPGCKCKDGYVRNDKGVCIPINTCPSCGGDENAQSGCGINCGKTCASIGQKPPIICPLICKLNSCDCRDGYYYDPNQKKCVKKEDCTPTCKENEIYSTCINGGCGPKNCSQINKPSACVHPKICIKGCICKEGYLRADNGTCIPKDQCPKNCPGQNEYYEPCIHACGSQNCSDKGKIYHCPIIVPGKCDSSGCRCKPGYLRDAKGVCIPEKECPPPACPSGEVWSTCPTVPCEGDKCPKTRDSPQSCPTGIVCSPPRCVCGYNRKRAENGTCILIPDCPPFKCAKNEVYVACPSICPGEKCSDYINQTKCPPYNIDISVNCRPACKCKKGYYRDEKGNCILACDCIQHPPKCGMNEVYDNCTSTSCKPTLCSELGYPLNCDKKCKPGCKCKDGYVRNDKGVCIPINTCPSCGGDENAQSGCGINCGKTCASIGQKPPIVCPKICKLNSCDCRDGFYYDPNQKKCVKKEDCTPTCKENEIYSTCINGGCGPKYCSQINQSSACVDPKICKKGCICKEGYLRADNGTCIPKDRCPPPHDCPYGEVWDKCPTVPCEGDKCPKTRDSPQSCPTGIVCSPPRCVCGYNRKRAENGTCIPIPYCPPFKCGKNEMYVACPSNCPGEKCSDYINQPKCPQYIIGVIENCKPTCKCIMGYYRDEKGNCIQACDCPVSTTTTPKPTPPPCD